MKRTIYILLAAALVSAEPIVTNGSFEAWIPFTGKTTERTPAFIGGGLSLIYI